jgi:hypothetical protein
MRTLITLLVIAFVMFSQANAQEKPLPIEKIQKVASKALVTLNELVTKENCMAMGFKSLSEVRAAKLGEYMQVFMVQLDQLQKYQPGSDPNKILSGGNRVIYPVTVNEQVLSSIVVEKVKEHWNATSFGGSNQVKMLTKVRKADSNSTRLPISSYFVLQIPALNLNFIAHQADEVLMLTPLLDDPSYGFKAGVTMLADKVFGAILPAAKGHDGLPR